MYAKDKLRPASYLAIIGGIGIGGSIIFPYFSVTFLITFSLNALDLGIFVWGPLILSAILALIAGINLNSNFGGNPKACLIISSLSAIFAWFIVYLQYQYYYDYSVQEYGYAIPLNFGIGLIVGIISFLLVIVAIVIVLSNQSSYNFVVNSFKQQKILQYQQSQRHIPLSPQPISPSPSLENSDSTHTVSSHAFCPICGRENTLRQKFCIQCGVNLELTP